MRILCNPLPYTGLACNTAIDFVYLLTIELNFPHMDEYAQIIVLRTFAAMCVVVGGAPYRCLLAVVSVFVVVTFLSNEADANQK